MKYLRLVFVFLAMMPVTSSIMLSGNSNHPPAPSSHGPVHVSTAKPVSRTRQPGTNWPLYFEAHKRGDKPFFIARHPGGSSLFQHNVVYLDLKQKATGNRERVILTLEDSNPQANWQPNKALQTRVHYLTGRHADNWQTNIAAYSELQLKEAYKGIDVRYYGNSDRRLEYDFIVKPNADPDQITMRFSGASKLSISDNGDLVLKTGLGSVTQHAPYSYQEINGHKQIVESHYRLGKNNTVKLQLASYDRSRPLIIDPVIDYASYLGGTGFDNPVDIGIDTNGTSYITGSTNIRDLPPGPAVSIGNNGGADVFVAALGPDGSLTYVTYIGGSGEDNAVNASVDFTTGEVLVTGVTTSADFPIAGNTPLDSTYDDGEDGFAFQLNNTGTALTFSTYLADNTAGFSNESGMAIAKNNFLYIAIKRPSLAGNFESLIISRTLDGSAFNPGWTTPIIDGTGDDIIYDMVVDASERVYFAGATVSTNLPVVNGLPRPCGTQDAFVGRLVADGSIAYLTCLGGSSLDKAYGIYADGTGRVFVTGMTFSSDFPTQPGPLTIDPVFQPLIGGGSDAFVTSFIDPGASPLAIEASTFIGGSGDDVGKSIRSFLLSGFPPFPADLFITGESSSADFPAINNFQNGLRGTKDAFVFQTGEQMTTNSVSLSSLMGGNGNDSGISIDVFDTGSGKGGYLPVIMITGQTDSVDFPVTPDTGYTLLSLNQSYPSYPADYSSIVQQNYAGGSDGFVSMIGAGSDIEISAVFDGNTTINTPFKLIVTVSNNGPDTVSSWFTFGSLPVFPPVLPAGWSVISISGAAPAGVPFCDPVWGCDFGQLAAGESGTAVIDFVSTQPGFVNFRLEADLYDSSSFLWVADGNGMNNIAFAPITVAEVLCDSLSGKTTANCAVGYSGSSYSGGGSISPWWFMMFIYVACLRRRKGRHHG